MLAHKVNENRIDFSEKVFIQPKLDGVRCIFTKDGAYSRTGKEFHNLQHIKIDLEKFFDQQPNAVLDGELYNHDLRDDFEQIISLVRKQKPTDEDRLNAHRLIQYHVYDMIAEGPSYEDRLNWLLSSKNSVVRLGYIMFTPWCSASMIEAANVALRWLFLKQATKALY